MPKKSAGILLFRSVHDGLEVFLVHPGGPLHAKKDLGNWSIPKGEFEDEDPLSAARREFEEETGSQIAGNFTALTPVKQKSGKWVYAWAVEGEFDPSSLVSNQFTMQWPTRSGKFQSFPEVDRGEWFPASLAKQKILAAQAPLIEELEQILGSQKNP